MTMHRDELEQRLRDATPALRAFIRRQVYDAAGAEDVQQNTFLQATRSIGALREPEKFRAWLQAIAKREIWRYFRERRDTRWETLERDIAAAAPGKRADLFEEFDATIRQLAAIGASPRNIWLLAMRFCLQWTPAEIAAATGRNVKTIHSGIQRALKLLRNNPSPAPLAENEDAWIKRALIDRLWLSGLLPFASNIDNERCAFLMRQAFALLQVTARQYPRRPDIAAYQALYGFFMAQFSSERGIIEYYLSDRRFANWKRTSWDASLRQQAEAAYQRFRSLSYPVPGFREYVEAMYYLYSPSASKDVDWRRVRALFEASHRSSPATSVPAQLGMVIAEIDGDMAGIRYLEQFRRHEALRHNPLYFLNLAVLCYRARQWKKAARYYRMFSRGLKNNTIRDFMRTRIQECDSHAGARRRALRAEQESR